VVRRQNCEKYRVRSKECAAIAFDTQTDRRTDGGTGPDWAGPGLSLHSIPLTVTRSHYPLNPWRHSHNLQAHYQFAPSQVKHIIRWRRSDSTNMTRAASSQHASSVFFFTFRTRPYRFEDVHCHYIILVLCRQDCLYICGRASILIQTFWRTKFSSLGLLTRFNLKLKALCAVTQW